MGLHGYDLAYTLPLATLEETLTRPLLERLANVLGGVDLPAPPSGLLGVHFAAENVYVDRMTLQRAKGSRSLHGIDTLARDLLRRPQEMLARPLSRAPYSREDRPLQLQQGRLEHMVDVVPEFHYERLIVRFSAAGWSLLPRVLQLAGQVRTLLGERTVEGQVLPADIAEQLTTNPVVTAAAGRGSDLLATTVTNVDALATRLKVEAPVAEKTGAGPIPVTGAIDLGTLTIDPSDISLGAAATPLSGGAFTFDIPLDIVTESTTADASDGVSALSLVIGIPDVPAVPSDWIDRIGTALPLVDVTQLWQLIWSHVFDRLAATIPTVFRLVVPLPRGRGGCDIFPRQLDFVVAGFGTAHRPVLQILLRLLDGADGDPAPYKSSSAPSGGDLLQLSKELVVEPLCCALSQGLGVAAPHVDDRSCCHLGEKADVLGTLSPPAGIPAEIALKLDRLDVCFDNGLQVTLEVSAKSPVSQAAIFEARATVSLRLDLDVNLDAALDYAQNAADVSFDLSLTDAGKALLAGLILLVPGGMLVPATLVPLVWAVWLLTGAVLDQVRQFIPNPLQLLPIELRPLIGSLRLQRLQAAQVVPRV